MSLWHTDIAAYELHSVRREFYSDDGRTNITTTVMVPSALAQKFAQDMMWYRSQFPLSILSGPSELRCRSAEVSQDKATYIPIAHADTPNVFEAAVSNYFAFVNLRYEAVTSEYLDNWLHDDLTIWFTCETGFDVEYLTLDYTKFVWDDGVDCVGNTKLRQDEAPGKRFVFTKYHVIIDHVKNRIIKNSQDEELYITEALERANGCVNAADDFVMWDILNTPFKKEQVLLTVNSIKKVMAYEEWIYTLDLTFSIRNAKRKDGVTEATWNMFWRPNQESDQANDDWYKILHIKKDGDVGCPEAKPYTPSSWVDKFSWTA